MLCILDFRYAVRVGTNMVFSLELAVYGSFLGVG